ncbi:hypothetical protein P7C70_g3379, partial [Phenoliferia sp. Uapishka_3]
MLQFCALSLLLGVISSTSALVVTRTTTTVSSNPPGSTPFNIQFSSYKFGTVSNFLSSHNLSASNYQVGSQPSTHTFEPALVNISGGALRLTVKGGTAEGGDVKCAQVTTGYEVLYANVTTRMKLGKVPGVCSASFFYRNDNAEIDIELLSSYITNSSTSSGVTPGLQFTNQALVAGGQETTAAVPYKFDPTAAFHDYTVVWTKGQVQFLVDGVLRTTFTTNVPSTPGSWVWNNWSSGNAGWTAGPPQTDNVLQIKSITGYYFSGSG